MGTHSGTYYGSTGRAGRDLAEAYSPGGRYADHPRAAELAEANRRSVESGKRQPVRQARPASTACALLVRHHTDDDWKPDVKYSSGKWVQGPRWAKTMGDRGRGQRWVEPFSGGLGAYRAIGSFYDRALLNDLSAAPDLWAAVAQGWQPNVVEPEDKQAAFDAAKEAVRNGTHTPQDVYDMFTYGFAGRAGGGVATKTATRKEGLRNLVARQRAMQPQQERGALEIRRGDYRLVLAECGKGDVVYLDPPYGDKEYFQTVRWNLPRGNDFNLDEMLELAAQAAARGATVYISVYAQSVFDPTKWVLVDGHRDQVSHYTNGESRNTVKQEMLYVDAATYNGGKAWFEGPDGVKRNKEAEQAEARKQVFALLGGVDADGYVKSDLGKVSNKITLDLAHLPGHEWAKTGVTNAADCVLIPSSLHRALDHDTSDVRIEDRVWRISGRAVEEWGYLDGTDVHQHRNARGNK